MQATGAMSACVAEGSHGARSPLTRVSVLDTHIFDCPWCGDHNRVVITDITWHRQSVSALS